MDLGQVYFWTNTVKDWKRIFQYECYTHYLISSWRELVRRGKITVYAFVIMPNHLHVVWEMHETNGKEMPHASFNKFTSHRIAGEMKTQNPDWCPYFQVDEPDRKIRIWQRDPLAILMDNLRKVEQKIRYIHMNPLQSHWNLAVRPEDYKWSSARFYEQGVDEFGFLTDYRERF